MILKNIKSSSLNIHRSCTNGLLYTYRSDSDGILPGENEILNERIVDPEGVIRSERVVLGVVHALDSVDIAE